MYAWCLSNRSASICLYSAYIVGDGGGRGNPTTIETSIWSPGKSSPSENRPPWTAKSTHLRLDLKVRIISSESWFVRPAFSTRMVLLGWSTAAVRSISESSGSLIDSRTAYDGRKTPMPPGVELATAAILRAISEYICAVRILNLVVTPLSMTVLILNL